MSRHDLYLHPAPDIAPLFDKFEPLPAGPLRDQIEALAARIRFPLGRLQLVHASKRSSHSNAYYYGFFSAKTIVLFDTLLGAQEDGEEKEGDGTSGKDSKPRCTDEEIVAVLSHELGHWKLNHTLKHFAIAQVCPCTQGRVVGGGGCEGYADSAYI